MAVGSVWPLFTVIIVALVYHAQSTVTHVKSSLNEECPTDTQSCITLQELAENFTTYTNNVDENITVTVVFLAGNHSLDSQLTFTNLSGVSLVKFADASNTSLAVTITCDNVTNFAFIDLNSVRVVGLTFVGCTGMRVQSVNQFTLEDSYFDGQNVSSGTALKLDRVSANILSSSFASYSGQNVLYLVSCCYNINPYNATLKVGGALIVNHSQVNIDNCEFNLNQVDIGGVIYSVNQSDISITNSNFINNRATFESDRRCYCGGGVLYSDGTSNINISHSQFRGNRALASGGVVSVVGYKGMNSDTSIAITNNSTFTDNSAWWYGAWCCEYIFKR